MDTTTSDLPLPISVVSLIEHWRGPMQRADFVTECGEAGQLALKSGLFGHPSVGFADLTPTGRIIRYQTIRLRDVQSDTEHTVAPIEEGVLRLIARFTDDGYLNKRSADTKAYLDIALALGLVAKTWPPSRLALTPKGQVVRQAALWTAPVEGDDEDEDSDVAMDAGEEAEPVSVRPVSIRGGAAPKAEAEPVEKPGVTIPASITKAEQRYLDLQGLQPADLKTPKPLKVRRPKEPAPGHGERRRKLAEDIKRWTTTTR